jgi:hypothetical protein
LLAETDRSRVSEAIPWRTANLRGEPGVVFTTGFNTKAGKSEECSPRKQWKMIVSEKLPKKLGLLLRGVESIRSQLAQFAIVGDDE